MIGADGCRELRVVGRGTPERGMLTNVMIRPFVAYLGESDKTWYVVAQSDGDDSFENYVCLDDSAGLSKTLVSISSELVRDERPGTFFAFEVGSSPRRYLYYEFEWCVDGKCNVNYSGRGGWTDTTPCSVCDCPRDEVMKPQICQDAVLWRALYQQAVLDASQNADADLGGESAELTVISAGLLSNLLAHAEAWVYQGAKVHHALHLTAQELAPALELTEKAVGAGSSSVIAATCKQAVALLAAFRPQHSPPAIPLRIGDNKPLKDLRAAVYVLLSELDSCATASDTQGVDRARLSRQLSTVKSLMDTALSAAYYKSTGGGVHRHDGGWTGAVGSVWLPRAVELRRELSANGFELGAPSATLDADLQQLCTRLDEYINLAVELLGGPEVVDADDEITEDAIEDDENQNGVDNGVCSKPWNALSREERTNAKVLGFIDNTWNDNSWAHIETRWGELRSEGGQRWDAAQALGFSRTSWLGGLAPREMHWQYLKPEQQSDARRLGFKSGSWIANDWSAIRSTWMQVSLQSTLLAAARRLRFDRATWLGGDGMDTASLEANLNTWGKDGFSHRFKVDNGEGMVDLLIAYHKKYGDLMGIKHTCAFVGGTYPCFSLTDVLHALQLRLALTAFYDKAFFPSLYAVATTAGGKQLFRGNARYEGLSGAATPTACVTQLFARTRPNVQTHVCPHQKAGENRLCLKQPDTHVWFDVLSLRSTDVWSCMPPTDGYNVMWSHAHAMLVFIVSALSSQVPAWAFGDDFDCPRLSLELGRVSAEFRSLMNVLSPQRLTSSGRTVTWHVTSAHTVFDHLVPRFGEQCDTPRPLGYDLLSGLETKHGIVKRMRERHSTSAASHVSRLQNKATLAHRELVYADSHALQSGELMRASAASARRRRKEVSTRRSEAVLAIAAAGASRRCRETGLGASIEEDPESATFGSLTELSTACPQHPILTAQKQSILLLLQPTEDEAATGDTCQAGTGADTGEQGVTGEGAAGHEEGAEACGGGGEEEEEEAETEEELETRREVLGRAVDGTSSEAERQQLAAQLGGVDALIAQRAAAADARAEGEGAGSGLTELHDEDQHVSPFDPADAPEPNSRADYEEAVRILGASGGDYRATGMRARHLVALCAQRGIRHAKRASKAVLSQLLESADASPAPTGAGVDCRDDEEDGRCFPESFEVGAEVEVEYDSCGHITWEHGIVEAICKDGSYEVYHAQYDESGEKYVAAAIARKDMRPASGLPFQDLSPES